MRRSLSNSQVRELLEAVDLRSPFGQRDHLLIMFLYQTGLRVSELSRLLIVHVAQGGRPRQQRDLPAAAPDADERGARHVGEAHTEDAPRACRVRAAAVGVGLPHGVEICTEAMLATFEYSAAVGTRTFTETTRVTYYSKL